MRLRVHLDLGRRANVPVQLLQVADLVEDRALVEIEVTAVVPE